MGGGLPVGRGRPLILRVGAPAKLNLGLELLAKRPDGYHELVSVVQCIDLYDVLVGREADSLTLEAPPETGPAESNLVRRAAVELRERAGTDAGASLVLAKGTPVGAGLGGGSSDAAAALRLLRRLWRVELPSRELRRIGAELGSDVPLFLEGPATLIRGRGERVTRLPPLRSGWFVLAVPPWEVAEKTTRVYRAVHSEDFSPGARTGELAAALRRRQPVDQGMFVNGLERPAERVFAELGELRRELRDATGAAFLLAGAGPALFGLFPSRSEAERCAAQAAALRVRVQIARPLSGLPPVRRVAAFPSPGP